MTPAPPEPPDEPARDGRGRVVARTVGVVLVLAGVVVLGFLVLRDRGDGDRADPGPPPTTALDRAAVTTAPTTPAGVGEGWADPVRGRRALRGFGEVAAVVTAPDGTRCEVCLLAALDEEQHARGLMEVTDPSLGGYDGMLFVFDTDQTGRFWMRDTPMPLSIAYLDAAGRPVGILDMAPCADSPSCPGYPSPEPFRYALEVPEGELPSLALREGSVLRLTGTTCPLAGR